MVRKVSVCSDSDSASDSFTEDYNNWRGSQSKDNLSECLDAWDELAPGDHAYVAGHDVVCRRPSNDYQTVLFEAVVH